MPEVIVVGVVINTFRVPVRHVFKSVFYMIGISSPLYNSSSFARKTSVNFAMDKGVVLVVNIPQ